MKSLEIAVIRTTVFALQIKERKEGIELREFPCGQKHHEINELITIFWPDQLSDHIATLSTKVHELGIIFQQLYQRRNHEFMGEY
jgi:hypothetical protein